MPLIDSFPGLFFKRARRLIALPRLLARARLALLRIQRRAAERQIELWDEARWAVGEPAALKSERRARRFRELLASGFIALLLSAFVAFFFLLSDTPPAQGAIDPESTASAAMRVVGGAFGALIASLLACLWAQRVYDRFQAPGPDGRYFLREQAQKELAELSPRLEQAELEAACLPPSRQSDQKRL